jgi:hypothetical protein
MEDLAVPVSQHQLTGMKSRQARAVGLKLHRRGFNVRQALFGDAAKGLLALAVVCSVLGGGCDSTTLTRVDGGPTDGGPDGGNQAVILTIGDYQNWCTVTVDGDGGYRPMAAFVLGSVVQLSASPQPGYVWGYWTGTDGDSGHGDTNQATTVTMNANKQVVACCPEAPPAAQTCPSPMP